MSSNLLPNTTQIPNVMIDEWMSHLTGSEFKVVMYVARRTYGFLKSEDSISLSQMANGIRRKDGTVLDKGTGLSKSSVTRAAKTLEDKKVLIRSQHSSEKRGDEPTSWKLNLDRVPKSATPPVSQNGTGRVPKSDTQNQVVQKTLQSNTTYSPSGADKPPAEQKKPETEQEFVDLFNEALVRAKDRPTPTSAFVYMGTHADLMDDALALSNKERGKMASQIQRAIDFSVEDVTIRCALSRMVAKRAEGVRLEFTDALNDVLTGPRPSKNGEKPTERRQKRMY